MWASPFEIEGVLLMAKRYGRARGVRQVRECLPLVDGGAASPRESWLRMLFIDAGLPRPTTQIVVVDDRGRVVKVFDMGWEEFQVAAEYDGDHHRTNRKVYVKDIRAMATVQRMGWLVNRVIKEDRENEIIDRARTALMSRGWRP